MMPLILFLGTLLSLPIQANGEAILGLWRLAQMNDAPVRSEITLQFSSANKISGKAHCNRYFGTAIRAYPDIQIGPIAATRMACPYLDVENAYFQILETATSVKRTNTDLILRNEAGQTLEFKPAD